MFAIPCVCLWTSYCRRLTGLEDSNPLDGARASMLYEWCTQYFSTTTRQTVISTPLDTPQLAEGRKAAPSITRGGEAPFPVKPPSLLGGTLLYGLIYLMLEFKPYYRFVSNSPTVMSRWYQAHIAGFKLHFFPVIHPYTKLA